MSVRLTGPELPARDKQREDQFLADNKARRDIVTLASGLQYRIISPGFGRSPRENEIVSLNYRGTLIDGTEIDSSFTRGEPAEFSMSSIMKGWKEALLLMPAGAKWQLFVPSELAYGERGLSRRIPGNATLLYELELVSIRDRNTPTSPAAFTTDFVQPGGFE
jgi:FKBP-type peptidyl-prolyl cis-trans isomerase